MAMSGKSIEIYLYTDAEGRLNPGRRTELRPP